MSLGRYGQPEYPHEVLKRHGFVRERCACGGVIESRTRLPSDVMAAMYQHVLSDEHQAGMVRWHEALG